MPQVVGNLSADDPPTKGTNPRCNDRGGKTAEHKMHAGPVWNDPVYDSVGVPNQQCNTADDAAALRGDALPFLARSTQFRFASPQVRATHPFTSNACEVIVAFWWESRQSSLAVRFLRD